MIVIVKREKYSNMRAAGTAAAMGRGKNAPRKQIDKQKNTQVPRNMWIELWKNRKSMNASVINHDTRCFQKAM